MLRRIVALSSLSPNVFTHRSLTESALDQPLVRTLTLEHVRVALLRHTRFFCMPLDGLESNNSQSDDPIDVQSNAIDLKTNAVLDSDLHNEPQSTRFFEELLSSARYTTLVHNHRSLMRLVQCFIHVVGD